MRLQCDDVTFDPETRQLWVAGTEVRLSPKAFDLLALLVARRPHAVSKADIHTHLWPGTFVSESSLPSLVSEIREAIADRRRKPGLVRTLHGFGYAFRADGPAADQPTFAIVSGWLVGSGAELALSGGGNVVGREGEGIVRVPSSTVSRRHARIVIDSKGGVVDDLGSKNGTFVNDRRVVAPTRIADGDQIRVGSVLFTFRLNRPSTTTETVPSSGRPRSRR